MKPLITVIIPVYRVERYLNKCVSSVQRQTYPNVEIILVDDGSPDNSGVMCDTLAEQDPRIRVIHKENGGLSSARNAGLDRMQGAYVCFLDSDDWIKEDMIQTLYDRMVQEDAQISCCGIGRYTGDTLVYCLNPDQEERFTCTAQQAQQELLHNRKITNSMCDKLFSAEIFRDLRMKEGILYEDMQLQHHCIHRAQRVTYTAEPLYCYHLSEGSILRQKFSLHHYDAIHIAQERIHFYREYYPELEPLAKAAWMEQALNFIQLSYGTAECDEKRRELTKQVLEPIPDEVKIHCSKRLNLKRSLLRLHPALLAGMQRLYSVIRNSGI